MKNNNILLYLMLIGIVMGGLCGWVFGKEMLAVDWIGEMFLDTLKMLVIPLIVSSMIVGIAGLGDIRKVGRAGTITLIYFLSTTGVAVLAGIIVVNIMQPGLGVELTTGIPEKVAGKTSVGITDIIKSFVTPNLIHSMVKMDILPIIMFSLIFGGVLTTLGEKGKLVISVFDGINIAIMKIVHLVMYVAPLGVFALIASKLGAAGGGDMFLAELLKIGKFAATVILGLLIHAVVDHRDIVGPLGFAALEYARRYDAACCFRFQVVGSEAMLTLEVGDAVFRSVLLVDAVLLHRVVIGPFAFAKLLRRSGEGAGRCDRCR